VTPEQHKSLFETGSDLNEAVSQAMKANPAAVHAQDVKLVLASCLIRQHKAITNVPMVSFLADLRAEHCDFLINSDSLYTPCQTPYCRGTCMCTEMLQCHRPYYDNTNLTLSCPVGTSFLRCHQSSNSLVNTNIHDTFSLLAHVCNRLHLPCSTADCHVCVQHAPLQVEPCFGAAKVQQTSFYQYMQTHSLPTITNTAHSSTSALQAFSSTCVYYVPRLPSATPLQQQVIRLYWLVANTVHTVHAKLLPIIQTLISTTQIHVQCSWHQHCHEIHMSSEVIQAVKTLTTDMHMQRSLAEWELTGKIILQTCKHISFGLVGLLIPCATTIAFQAIRVVAVVSISLLQSIMKLTKAAPRKRMQCSILYYLLKSVYHVDCTLGQENGQVLPAAESHLYAPWTCSCSRGV